jgi:hypothetical protein
MVPADSARSFRLRARCEAQRVTLSAHVSDIEDRLRSANRVLGTVRSVFTGPAVIAGGAALLLTMARPGWWSMLSRGVVFKVQATIVALWAHDQTAPSGGVVSRGLFWDVGLAEIAFHLLPHKRVRDIVLIDIGHVLHGLAAYTLGGDALDIVEPDIGIQIA